MPTIRKSLLQLVFSGSYMKRWNDKLRPMELMEVDKQAHKMLVAWLLFMLNTRDLPREERLRVGGRIVEGGLFEYFYRLVITDIKPPVFYQIKSNPDHYRQLTAWVLGELKPRVQPLGPELWERMTSYLSEPHGTDLSRRILDAAHLYASSYEFGLIKGLSRHDEEMQDIERSFQQGLNSFEDLAGVAELLAGPSTTLGRFAHLCGQLRFQKRWSQTPRIPETSVLGHMFIVAAYAYFFSLAVGACQARRQNDFFAGLVHDLPELLTRDIISPVKKSVAGIGELIKEYEDREVRRRVFAPLEAGGYQELSKRLGYFLGSETGSEFNCAAVVEGQVRKVGWDDLQERYNEDQFDPKDGILLKVCDSLAAFIEAYTALRHGITSDHLQQSVLRLRNEYQHVTLGEYIHVGALLADFD